MIKKPKKLGYTDLLRSNDMGKLVSQKNKEQREYEINILTELVKEFGTASLGELLFCVVEAHHKKLKIKHKRGTKEIWSNLVKSMIRVEVDSRRKREGTYKRVKHNLKNDPIWNIFLLSSESQFDKVYKQGHLLDTYSYAKAIHKRSNEEWNALAIEERTKFKRAQKYYFRD